MADKKSDNSFAWLVALGVLAGMFWYGLIATALVVVIWKVVTW